MRGTTCRKTPKNPKAVQPNTANPQCSGRRKDLLHNPEGVAPLVEGDIDEDQGGPDHNPQVRQRPPLLPDNHNEGNRVCAYKNPPTPRMMYTGHGEVEENDMARGKLRIPDEGLMPGCILLRKEAGRENEHEGIRH